MIAQLTAEHPQLSVRHLCALLGVSRSWFYTTQQAQQPDAMAPALRAAIEQIVLEFAGYGYRRVTAALQRAGWQVNHKRVLRIMREEALLCQLKRRWVPTTDSQHGLRVYPNLLGGLALQRLDQAWVADISYIRLPRCFVYLAVVLDAYSRRCIGWKLSKTIDTQLALDALERALNSRQVRAGLIHHSDRGVQYASSAYVERLLSVGAQISMSGKGNPYDNAKAESFFKTLKYEEVYLKDYRDFQEAEENIGPFIEDVYNQKRLHSSLGYLPPIEFEQLQATTSEILTH
jgi:putative transposase